MNDRELAGRAASLIHQMPPVRTDLVAAMRAKVNAPGYDVDAELADAIEVMLTPNANRPTSQRGGAP